MKAPKLLFINFLCVLLSVACSNNSPSDTSETTSSEIEILDTSTPYEALDVSYGPAERQKLDLYLPANRTAATKTIILLHGGSWISGKKEDMNFIKLLLTENFKDLAIVTMNYRLADTVNPAYPMQIEDISSVINFITTNKIKYTISNTIGFIGFSAGGHLSLLWSYTARTSANVNMVCSIVGPVNFTDPAYTNSTSQEFSALLNILTADKSTAALRTISPLHQLSTTAPPTILFYGAKDPLVPSSQGIDLKNALEKLEIPHEFTLYENGSHGWIGPDLEDTWLKLSQFINVYL